MEQQHQHHHGGDDVTMAPISPSSNNLVANESSSLPLSASSNAFDSRAESVVVDVPPASVEEKKYEYPEDPTQRWTWDCCFVFKVGLPTVDVNVHLETDDNDENKDEEDPKKKLKRKKSRVTKETITQDKLFEMTTADIVQRLEGAGLKTDMWKSVQDDEVYVRVGATEERLMREAARVQHDLLLDPTNSVDAGLTLGMTLAKQIREKNEFGKTLSEDLFRNVYGRYDAANKDGSDLWRQKLYTRYPSIDRMNALRNKIHHFQGLEEEKDLLKLELEAMEEEELKRPQSLFTSTDRIKLTVGVVEGDPKEGGAGINMTKSMKKSKHSMIAFFPLHENKKRDVLVKKWIQWKSTFQSPLNDIREYFGEKVALYFAFLQFYNKCLLPAAIIGLIFFIYQLGEGRVDVRGIPAFAVFISFWATLFLEGWKRREAKYRVRWGTSKFQEKEQTRPEFYGEWEPSPITGQLMETFPAIKRIVRAMCSQTVVWTLIGVVIAAVVGVFFFRKVLQQDGVNQATATYVSAILNAVQIQVLNQVYGRAAVFMNNFENHRTDSDYENALIAKNFLFKFVNSYNSLFYVAFFKQYDDTVNGCVNNDCLRELQQQLATIFVALIIINNTIEVGIPYIKQKIADRQNSVKQDENAPPVPVKPKSIPEQEYELSAYESTFDDFDELVIQFGFVTLFVVAFPITPLLALINNVFETRVDSTKLCKLTRRPEPRGAYDIGTWSAIINIVSFIAVITNCAIICFETKLIDEAVDTTHRQYQIFIIAEHLIIVIKFAIAYFVPDEPQELVEHFARQEHIVNVLINGAEEIEEAAADIRRNQDDTTKHITNFDWSRVSSAIRDTGMEI